MKRGRLCSCHGVATIRERRSDRSSGEVWRCYVKKQEKAARYAETHRDQIRAAGQRYYSQNSARIKKRASDYYAANRERVRAVQKRWQETAPSAVKSARIHRYRAKLAKVPHEPWTREQVFRRGLGVCWICGAALRAGWHTDHVVPVCLGGPDVLRNLLPACPSCNAWKKDRPVSLVQLPPIRNLFHAAVRGLVKEAA